MIAGAGEHELTSLATFVIKAEAPGEYVQLVTVPDYHKPNPNQGAGRVVVWAKLADFDFQGFATVTDGLDRSAAKAHESPRTSHRQAGAALGFRADETATGEVAPVDAASPKSGAVQASIFSPAAILGVGTAIGMAVHNLATYNPDYEIGKNKIAGTVTVKYVK